MIMKCYWEGRYAYMDNKSVDNNPYFVETREFQSWRLGWYYGQSLMEGD